MPAQLKPREDTRVLIVEDAVEDADHIGTMLSAAGFSIRLVADGHAALLEMDAWHPSAVLVDLRLRERDARRFCAEVARRSAGERLPIVLIGALPNLLKRVSWVPDGFVPTPVDDALLVNTLRRATS